ncbi:MAG: enoyl-CoA hydratase/isomerase family protein, partial [Pseudomonadota bacterium]
MDHLPLSVEAGVGVLRIERVDKRNALSEAMVQALSTRCCEIEARDDIDALILTGSEGIFCSGGDIDDWSSRDAATFGRRWVRDGHL